MIYATPGEEILSRTANAPGLTGTIAFRFVDLLTGAGVTDRLTTGITESEDSPGLYIATRPAPDAGIYAREWWDGAQAWYDNDDLEVTIDGQEPGSPVWRPSLAEVSALEHSRTNVMGSEIGIFNTDTEPTATQVTDLITLSVTDVQSAVGITIPDKYASDARAAAARRAASLIESSYFAREIDTDRSTYKAYTAQYLGAVESLSARIPRALRLT